MKKSILFIIFILVFSLGVWAADGTQEVGEQEKEQAQETTAQQPPEPTQEEIQAVKPPEEVNLGNIYFPRPFVHAGKDYDKGVYRVKLSEKEGAAYFFLYRKNELVLEEMAVVKELEKPSRVRRFRLRKEFMKDFEYFRIRVTRPDKLVMAYFLVKQ
jgi:hypothetical protein